MANGNGAREMSLPERLRVLRDGHSRAEFAKTLGVPESTLRRYEQGLARVPADFLERICRTYGVSADWLLFGVEASSDQVVRTGATRHLTDGNGLGKRYVMVDGEKVRVVCVPVLTRVPAGPALFMEDATPVGTGLEGWMWVPDPGDPNAFGLVASGDSMEPVIRDGQPFLVSPRRGMTLVSGLAVLRIRGEEVCVKMIRRRADSVEVRSANPVYPLRHYRPRDVQIIGEVLLAEPVHDRSASMPCPPRCAR